MVYHTQVQTQIKNSYLSSGKMKLKEVAEVCLFSPLLYLALTNGFKGYLLKTDQMQ